MERRARDPQQTRARLLDAARVLFARHGLHGVSIADITKRAKVSIGMVNHHFGSKEELYRACLDELAELRLQALDRFAGAARSPEELRVRLELLLRELLDLHLAHPEVVTILLRDLGASDVWGAALERKLDEFTPRLATFFAEAQKLGVIRRGVDPVIVASMLYLTLQSLLQADVHPVCVRGLTLRDARTRSRVLEQLLEVVLHGVLPRGADVS